MSKFLRGQSLVEILLAIGVFMIAIVTLAVLALDGMTTQRLAQERGIALQLAQEGLDATRSIRDANYSDLTAGSHGIVQSAGRWIFSGASDIQNGYTRVISVSSTDAYHRYVTSTVSWTFSSGRTERISLATLFTDWRNGAQAPPTTLVLLDTLNLPGSSDATAVAVSSTIAYVGRLTSGSDDLDIIDVSSSTNAVRLGGFETSDSVTAVALSATYAYVGGTNDSREIRVLNVTSSTAPSLVLDINLPGNGNVTYMYASGTRLYVSRVVNATNPTFSILDISNPAAPTILGNLALGDTNNDVVITNTAIPYAYLASSLNNQEFQIVNTATPTSMILNGSVDIAGTENMASVSVSGTVAFGGSLLRASSQEFFTFNVTNPLLPSNLGSLEVGASVNAVRMDDANTIVVLGTASTTAEAMLVSASDPVNPIFVTKLNLSDAIMEMTIQNNIAYLATADQNNEFQILGLQ